MIQRLSPLDATFLHIETRATPMHVASLMILARPANAAPDFIKQLVQRYRAPQPLQQPWNLKLARAPLSALVPAVEQADAIDMEYHIRHTALPDPGGERELGELISHLHSQMLDRSRPLWTCHIIEGLAEDRFAIYVKMHHALTDGINGMRMLTRCLADTAEGTWAAPWHWQKPPRARSTGARRSVAATPLRQWPGMFGRALKPLLQRHADAPPVLRPFEAPRSPLNGTITAARRVATQQVDLARIQHLARRAQVSVNDVFLALCSSALRRHLLASGNLPDDALIAGVPVSLREAGQEGGNAIGFLWATLGTDQADPRARLAAIHASMQASKHHLQTLPNDARLMFTMLTMAPAIGVLMSGLGARVRPPMNISISNVPGPSQPLYLNGAQVQAIYPVSIPFQGQGLNITCVSYAGRLDIGFTGCRDSLTSLQKIAVYTGEALDELEAAFA